MKTILKTECILRRKLEEKIITIFDTYSYDEVKVYGEKAENYALALNGAIKTELLDEVKPYRIFGFKDDKIYAMIAGIENPASDAEMLVLMINVIIACGIHEFKLEISGDSAKAVAGLMVEYGLSDYINVKESDDELFEFCGINVADGRSLFSGKRYVKDGIKGVYSVIDKEMIVDVLYGGEDLKTGLLPVAIVGSDYPALRHKVAFGLRTQGLKIEEFISLGTMTDMLELAELKGITVSIWADGEKLIMKNMKSGEMTESTIEKLLGENK